LEKKEKSDTVVVGKASSKVVALNEFTKELKKKADDGELAFIYKLSKVESFSKRYLV